MRYRWPGNVRELSNLLERLSVLFGHRTVRVEDLPERYSGKDSRLTWPRDESAIELSPQCVERLICSEENPPVATVTATKLLIKDAESGLGFEGLDLKNHLSGIESMMIRQALGEANGAVAGAARLLHMRRTTLVEKLRKYRLSG
jgi:sigma-54 specific flagellar transcriptional regulator A